VTLQQIEEKEKRKRNFWKIAFIILGVLTPIAVISDIMESKGDDTLMAMLMIPLMPGFLIYVLVTGDIHGSQPGPVGQGGWIIVTILGSWIFWTPLVYRLYKKRRRSK
jgi:hypothetical protein